MMDHALRGLATARNRAKASWPGSFGNESSGTLVAFAHHLGPQGPQPSAPHGIVNQNRNTRQDVLQSNEIIGHGPRG
jgi:hypothetical protein